MCGTIAKIKKIDWLFLRSKLVFAAFQLICNTQVLNLPLKSKKASNSPANRRQLKFSKKIPASLDPHLKIHIESFNFTDYLFTQTLAPHTWPERILGSKSSE